MDFRESRPAHVAVRVDGVAFDGGGETSAAALRERAYHGVREQDWDDIILTEIETPAVALHDPVRVNDLRKRIEAAVDR